MGTAAAWRRDDPALRDLKAAMAVAPIDETASTTAAARALASIPWAAAKEPFASTVRARVIFAGH